MSLVSDIKLIRTDTTLDLSQKAEKGMNVCSHPPGLYIAPNPRVPPFHMGLISASLPPSSVSPFVCLLPSLSLPSSTCASVKLLASFSLSCLLGLASSLTHITILRHVVRLPDAWKPAFISPAIWWCLHDSRRGNLVIWHSSMQYGLMTIWTLPGHAATCISNIVGCCFRCTQVETPPDAETARKGAVDPTGRSKGSTSSPSAWASVRIS
jgi:hypothetical protein